MTSQMRTQISNGLHWVRDELDKSLDRARQLIEHHSENIDDSVPLQKALVEIHTVRGTALLIQCFGVAILAEEMKQVLLVLMLRKVKETEPAYSALLGAAVQLSDYIGSLARGEEDCVLVLQPLLNELRLSRSKPILTEPELFAAHIQAIGLMMPMAPSPNPGAQEEARKLLPYFQKALLSWLKNDPEARISLGRIGRIAQQIAERCTEIRLHQLWRVVAATMEALLGDELDQLQDIKRLIGAVGQQIKLLADGGEAAALDKLGDLSGLLTYFIGRSSAKGARVVSLRKTFQLETYLPSATVVEDRRLRMRGPGASLLEHVADEIRRDIGRVKDNIDLVVRSGSNDSASLADIRARLRKVAATLAALGLVPLQRVIESQVKQLEVLNDSSNPDRLWMDVATSILRVELGLEDALFRQVSHHDGGSDVQVESPHRHDLAESVAALLRASLVNISHIKTSVDAYIREGAEQSVQDAAKMLDEIGSGLRILQNERVAGLVDHLVKYIRSPAFTQVRGTQQRAERFADAIASVEYYIEATCDQLPIADPILDRLERYVLQLELGEDAVEPVVEEESAVLMQSSPAPSVLDSIDPEIRDIFIEEASEVLDTLQEAMPALRRNGQDKDALAVVRRAFHTLKGSGRMVGAKQIGEFGWAIEHLLNRCLEGALGIDALVLDAVDDAVKLLPQLIENFRDGRLLEESALLVVIEHANHLAAGRAEDAPEADMAVVFREDAHEKLATVEHWLAAQDSLAGEHKVESEIVRSFHTLRGAGHVVNLPAISELAMELEAYLNAMRIADLSLPSAAMDLIRDITATLQQWVSESGTTPAPVLDAAPLIARIRALQTHLPQLTPEQTDDNQLAEIFAGEAFELLQKIESALVAWAHAPDFNQAAADIRDLSHTLRGAALMSHCPAIAKPARCLSQCMARLAVSQRTPEPAFFETLTQCMEEFFQVLDGHRDETFQNDGSALAERITQLDEAQHLIEATIGVAQTGNKTSSPGVDSHLSDDAELRDIFIGEAQELMQNFDSCCAAWEENPSSIESAHEIKRVLHTLKGSSRVAGFGDIGDFAARLEKMMADAVGSVDDSVLLTRLHQASDGLHRVLDDMGQGLTPDFHALLVDLDAAKEAAEPPLDVMDFADGSEMPLTVPEEESELQWATEPVSVPAPIDVPALVQPEAVPQPSPTAPMDTDVDTELVQIFSAETSELLENLQQALRSWQREPRDLTGAREMQRVLHTLKGGARMAGMNAIGNLAHDMETRINTLELLGEADVAALGQLAGDVDSLHHMHDLMERGDYAPLRQEIFAYAELTEEVATETDAAAFHNVVEMAVAPQVVRETVRPSGLWDPQLFWKPEDDAAALIALRRETARVPVENLDAMLNQAGEISIYRSRLEEHNNALQLQLNEMTQAIARVRDQLRLMDIETDAQITARGMGHSGHGSEQDRYAAEFDALEMDRYTRMQELSRSLSESIGDLSALHGAMDGLTGEAETLLLQQGRINTQVQQGLMGTLMVPFSRQVARLQRVVKQTASENGKQADSEFFGIESELDRNVLERMTAPLEHLLRNSVVHGLEDPQGRVAADKPAMGMVRVSLRREGTQLLIELSDDGKGLDYNAIRHTAVRRGLMSADAALSDDEVAQFIFEPGFSTAKKLTQDAGRGIGMDVVASEVKQLGGTLELASEAGKGTRFLIRLPLNLAISQALLVEAGHDLFAIPLVSIEGIVRIAREQLDDLYREDGVLLPYAGHDYRVYHLGDFIGLSRNTDGETKTVSAILVRLGEGLGTQERRVAVVVDALHGNREIVSKAVGPLVNSVTGVSGATILADGRVVLILDVSALALERHRRAALFVGKHSAEQEAADAQNLIMVVDDSVTIRRVTERLLVKQGYKVITAKDGLDAMAKLQTEHPAAVLLDIEMPRADGFEVATFIRNSERIHKMPIIMITSRSGDKHRDRATQIGVNRYLIKPFQEDDLLRELRNVILGGKA
jgi:chemosensory pili system protein ChpA (sensor histidine kinase/response regulator)